MRACEESNGTRTWITRFNIAWAPPGSLAVNDSGTENILHDVSNNQSRLFTANSGDRPPPPPDYDFHIKCALSWCNWRNLSSGVIRSLISVSLDTGYSSQYVLANDRFAEALGSSTSSSRKLSVITRREHVAYKCKIAILIIMIQIS